MSLGQISLLWKTTIIRTTHFDLVMKHFSLVPELLGLLLVAYSRTVPLHHAITISSMDSSFKDGFGFASTGLTR